MSVAVLIVEFPTIACVLFPLAYVAAAPGTSIVVKRYCALAGPGTQSNRPSDTAVNILSLIIFAHLFERGVIADEGISADRARPSTVARGIPGTRPDRGLAGW